MIYTLAGQGVSVLATTHYMDEAEFCNVTGMMYNARLIALDNPDSLKEAMEGILLEVDCNQPGAAEPILQALLEVTDVAAHGVLLHVLVEAETAEYAIRQALVQNGIDPRRIERVLPSLEDVFVYLVGEENRLGLQAEIE
jgi:ABC-2 type transport system ATP-binding protein